ncbi:MAG: hypothetical protein HOP31_03440 [Ignavibacteria bacterium]|nr:hypothetical protein [Ignavibacteria bacterium]
MRLLYNYLKKYHPDYSHKDFTKENTYYCLYSAGENYDDKKLRERFSDMMRLAEEFLSILYIRKKPLEHKRQTLYEYVSRGLDVHFNKKNNEIRKILDETEIKDVDYFMNEFIYESDKNVFFAGRELLGRRKSVFVDLAGEIDLFLKYVSSRMLIYYVLIENWKEGLNHKFESKFYESVISFIEDNNMTEYPFVKALYLRLKIIENGEDDSLYYDLKNLFLNNPDKIERQHMIRIATILHNDATGRYLQGKEQFEIERFEIMKYQLENDMIYDERAWLSRENYFNYVSASINLNDLKWAEEFIENYTDKIDPKKREDACCFAKGLLCYHKKEYDEALTELSRIKGNDYVYQLKIKALHTRIYFELDDLEKVLVIIDSLKHYVSSNLLIPQTFKRRYTNYNNILYKLTRLKLNPDEFKASKLIDEIKSSTMDDLTTNKTWLLEMAMELKGKF